MTENTSKHSLKVGIVLNTTEGSLQGRTPRFSDLQALTQAAEQVGLDSVWLADHLIYRFPGQDEAAPWEMFTMLSALAAVTKRIRLGSVVACTSFRPPALTAKMADALDEISDGRFVLGLGAGWHKPEYDAFGYPFDHLASRFEEALQIIVPLLREGHVDFHGNYYEVSNCVLRPRGPSRSGPPILIGARRPRMLRLTAQYADAWNTAWHVDVDVVKQRYEEFQQACAAEGRDPGAIELNVGTAVRLPGGEDEELSKAIAGSPEEIASKLQEFGDAGARHLIVILDPLTQASIEQFGRVVELLRKA
jgi:alkanesulfonate monooxygenase SsuD/methylene tetrahydromethanopterin reductase-like flavin-dependent oxidoreductase (luciferase family)